MEAIYNSVIPSTKEKNTEPKIVSKRPGSMKPY